MDQEAQALVARWRRSGSGKGIWLGRGNFGQALLYEGRVLKLPVARDMHGRLWAPSEIRAAFRQEAEAATALRAAGFDVVPATTLVEDAQGPVLVREFGEPAGPLTLAEWDRLSQRLGAVQDAGWAVHDQLLLLRRPTGSLFVGDVGIWRRHPGPIRYADDDLPILLAHVVPRGIPRFFPSWQEVEKRGREARARWDQSRAHAATLGRPWPTTQALRLPMLNLTTLYGSVRLRLQHQLPIPGPALDALNHARQVAASVGFPWPPTRGAPRVS